MKIVLYQVDAFTDKVFGGNPASVCILQEWLPNLLLQHIAAENNLAETAFLVRKQDNFEIRWFTPIVEVDLCGHATLASAHVLFYHLKYTKEEIVFHSHRSGELRVKKQDNLLTLNFPADVFEQIELIPEHFSCFDRKPIDAYRGKTDMMFIFDRQSDIEDLQVNLQLIKQLKARGVIVTARGLDCDFVSRFFAPQSGIDEDPVTGSAHTTLTPYWSKVLDKKQMTAMQLSARKGHLTCTDMGERVEISGNAVTYLSGEINV
jgi:PhzF family phenazine biosynthesis protein